MSPRILDKRHLMFDRECNPQAVIQRFIDLHGCFPAHIIYPERHALVEADRIAAAQAGVEIITMPRVRLYCYAGPVPE